MPIDLSTNENKLIVLANLKDLVISPGWKIFEIIVKENIDVVKGQILNGTTNETISDIQRLRDKLAVHTETLDKVYKMIEDLTPTTQKELPSDDPFEESTQK